MDTDDHAHPGQSGGVMVKGLARSRDCARHGRWAKCVDAGPFDASKGGYSPMTARMTFFGRLIASGAHTASMILRQVHLSAAGGALAGGCISMPELRLLKPVVAGEQVRVMHTFLRQARNRIESKIEAFGGSGEQLARMLTIHACAAKGGTDAGMGRRVTLLGAARPAAVAPSVGRTGAWLEDCIPGVHFGSGPFRVGAHEPEEYNRQFGGGAADRNEWLCFSYSTKLFIEAMWKHGHSIAGLAVSGLEFFGHLQPGDEVVGDVEVLTVRPLRSKPGLGFVELAVSSWVCNGASLCKYSIGIVARRRSV